ncbi:MAG: peroxidase-related enzyme [Sneathiella sp.]|nr:peroxidase-related enzyme [Sneathiella sp.]
MQRIPEVDRNNLQEATAATLDAVKAKLGKVPNIFLTMANAPALLKGFLAFSEEISNGRLPASLREQIALVTAGANGCNYCASAHSALGRMAGLSANEISMNLAGSSSDAKAAAALKFTHTLVVERGVVNDGQLAQIRAAGFTDEEILEILGNVALNLVTNYFNHLVDTDIDFPLVEASARAA